MLRCLRGNNNKTTLRSSSICYLYQQIGAESETANIFKSRWMADKASSSSSSLRLPIAEDEEGFIFGSESGWVEARTHCDHLDSLSSDLSHIPTPDTLCSRCQHPKENWLCLSCKDVLCSRFINKHMLEHYQEVRHCLALSYSDLSVWCFSCDAYLDAQVISQLRPVYEIAYTLKFGEAPPSRAVENSEVGKVEAETSSSAK